MASTAIRTRTATDLDTCVLILAEVHKTAGYPVNWPADPGGWLSPDNALGCWVLTVDDEVAGHLIVTAEGDQEALVERLFVDPRRTGGGLGGQLLAYAVAFAAEQHRRLLLDVVDSRHGAAGFYRRAGWREIGRTPIDWGGTQASELIRFSAPSS
ncbi:GNAT family N-acetyltransferase [Kribbella sp. NPDC056861]|uniref:GNAT family N-acetyltransferase n=1 Tax=Kribbella sp. NPDC056861 TaxID=3154857 RepID=UPI00342778E6